MDVYQFTCGAISTAFQSVYSRLRSGANSPVEVGTGSGMSAADVETLRQGLADGSMSVADAWKALAEAGDSYADDAYVITGMPNSCLSKFVKEYWKRAAGEDSLDKFDAVARDHIFNYLEEVAHLNGAGWPSSDRIEASYRNSLERNGVSPQASVDGILGRGECWLWQDTLGLEQSRWKQYDGNDDLDVNKGLSDLIAAEYITTCNIQNDVRDKIGAPSRAVTESRDSFQDASKLTTPLILDLDGDGVELTSLANSNAYFDLDGDGFAEKTRGRRRTMGCSCSIAMAIDALPTIRNFLAVKPATASPY